MQVISEMPLKHQISQNVQKFFFTLFWFLVDHVISNNFFNSHCLQSKKAMVNSVDYKVTEKRDL